MCAADRQYLAVCYQFTVLLKSTRCTKDPLKPGFSLLAQALLNQSPFEQPMAHAPHRNGKQMIESLQAQEIESLLDNVADGTKILSLDCFDTLVWRNVNMPTDIFYDLDIPDCSMEMRVLAEKRARKALAFETQKHEVTIADIYTNLFRGADAQQISSFVAKELAAEAMHCFAFKPVVKLITAAKERDMKVIIVSDTYLPEPLLRQLITDAAGQDVIDDIDDIFCSCEYGVNKASGLFEHVLSELNVAPETIVHLGDNKVADHDSPMELGIHGVHFDQFDDEAMERLRLEAAAATLLEKDTRKTSPALQPHRAQISLRQNDDAIYQFGHDVLGPIYQGFSNWIAEEASALKAETGKKPKLLFLLRDGYLPAQAFLKQHPDFADQVAMIELSRFTANASSFTDEKAIKDYLIAEVAGSQKDAYSQQRQAAFCKQMLFFSAETKKIAKQKTAKDFIAQILKPQNVKKIINRSTKFRSGLLAHLAKHGVERGDVVMFVDLGYNGSVQNAIAPVLSREMDLDIHGHYLLLRELMISGQKKKGLIDKRNYDINALHSLCESIAVLEQLSTQSNGSVLGYNEHGEPKRDTADIKGQQSESRDAAQAACLEYIESTHTGWNSAPHSWDNDCARRMSASALTRLLFLPVEREVGIFENFRHDVNMGTKDMIQLIDPKGAADGLRRRGLFYSKNITRMYLPGELKQAGMQTLLPLFTSTRFGLDLRQDDFQSGGIEIPVMLANDQENMQIEVTAYPTSEGYYQALIPAGTGQLTIAIMMGQICDWFQVEEVSFHEIDQFMAKKIDDDSIAASPIFDTMTENAPGLHRCSRESAFILVPPPAKTSSEGMMLSFVFRPTIKRAKAVKLREVA